MTQKIKQTSFDLDELVENQLNLQVKISYTAHHDFMTRHKMNECSKILDVGTGNGLFAARLAEDHPSLQFVGIDKRKHCVESCQKLISKNFEVLQLDMFSRNSTFDFSEFNGFLMRYFLLHVDHSRKILELLKVKSKKPARFWIIDLDLNQFSCEPKSEIFDQMKNLVKEFCLKTSVDSLAGQRVAPMLEELNYQNITFESVPFSTKNMNIDDLVLYLKQEVQCYSVMSGKSINDPHVSEILKFLDEDVRSGKFQISYGMILLYAELN